MSQKTNARRPKAAAKRAAQPDQTKDRNYVAEVRSQCRKSIISFLQDECLIEDDTPRATSKNILIATGPPGTGKTCTISEILASFVPQRKIVSLMGNHITNMPDLINGLATAIPKRGTRRSNAVPQNTLDAFAFLSTRLDQGRDLVIFIDEFDLIFELSDERIKSGLMQFTKVLLGDCLIRAKLIASLNNHDFIDKWSHQLGTPKRYIVVPFTPYTAADAFDIAYTLWPSMREQTNYEFVIRKVIKKTNGDLRQVLNQLSEFMVGDDSEGDPLEKAANASEPTPRDESGKRGRRKKDVLKEDSPPKLAPHSRKHQESFKEISSEGSNELIVEISSIDAEETEPTSAPNESTDWVGHGNKATYFSPPKTRHIDRPKPSAMKPRECTLADIQQRMGLKYMTDGNALAHKISALPRIQQLICAAICVLIDREVKAKNLNLNELYRVYRELVEESHAVDTLSRAELESELHSLSTQGIIHTKSVSPVVTPPAPVVKVQRNRTPVIKSRIPNMRPAMSNMQFDFPLDIVGTCNLFEKLKNDRIYGFTMTQMTKVGDDYSD